MDFETASDLLRDECRRAVIEVLRNDSPISRRELAERLVTRNVEAHGGTETGAADPAARYRIHVALSHDHLPRLADAGLINYDDETAAATPELDSFVEWYGPLAREQETTGNAEATEETEPTDDLRDQLMAFYA